MNQVLEHALVSGNVAGAYLIEGATEEAVKEQADSFLRRLFCVDGSGCVHCPGCQKYDGRTHADLLEIIAETATIKVDEVREIPAFVSNKSYEGGYQAVLIPQADKMTEQAQNALLKVLEEPPGDTVIVLGAQDNKNLLPTIRSRCIIIKTQKSAPDSGKRLMQEFDLPTIKAQVLMKVAGGDYHLAKKYAEEGYFEVREDMILALNRLFVARNMATSLTEKLFLKHEQNLREAIDIAILYLRDVLTFKHTGGNASNEDKMQEIIKHAKVSDRVLVNTLDILAGYAMKCEQCPGLNKKLVLTGTLFDILEVVI